MVAMNVLLSTLVTYAIVAGGTLIVLRWINKK